MSKNKIKNIFNYTKIYGWVRWMLLSLVSEGWSEPMAENFIIYLNKHKHRIVNYDYLQEEGISLGSGSVESKIKQIDHRLKITGASRESCNVPQVLCHRCAYLNGCLF
jgi:hypothetical protein